MHRISGGCGIRLLHGTTALRRINNSKLHSQAPYFKKNARYFTEIVIMTPPHKPHKLVGALHCIFVSTSLAQDAYVYDIRGLVSNMSATYGWPNASTVKRRAPRAREHPPILSSLRNDVFQISNNRATV